MSSGKSYQQWGAFGTATENTEPEPRPEIASGICGSTWGLTEETFIDSATGVVTHKLTIENGDAQEKIDDARASINREIRKAVLKSPAGELYRLSGGRDAMSAPIETAMSLAMNHEDVHSVWAALVEMALREDRAAPLLGMTDDGLFVEYRGNGGITTMFSFPMLKGRLRRQGEARSGK
ncbi:hypothetical protein [Rugamonas sp.]|uniref:hypothetical protein n=1 Tax=Rugamonas sp. TaxID=1926287 RepID=UPI0025CB7B3E|nr:hypothetical protein [Rugamonas sp.]